MNTYGILLVDTSWANDDSVRIDKMTSLHHRDHLVKGAHALIYMRAPVEAVVAEAVVTGSIVEQDDAPPQPSFNPAIPKNLHMEHEGERMAEEIAGISAAPPTEMAKTYAVPLRITRRQERTPPIPLSRLRLILGSDFSVFDETWMRLSAARYREIVAVWEKAR